MHEARCNPHHPPAGVLLTIRGRRTVRELTLRFNYATSRTTQDLPFRTLRTPDLHTEESTLPLPRIPLGSHSERVLGLL